MRNVPTRPMSTSSPPPGACSSAPSTSSRASSTMPTPIVAANAYAALAKLHDQAANLIGGAGGGQETGPSFSAMLKDVIDAVSEAGQKSDAQAQAVAAGKANMIDVVTAV